ncbi:MAG: RdgB/HAM1 family non-canonical purine NTP pyrophosphatase [Gammaproteobacteria bacterium]
MSVLPSDTVLASGNPGKIREFSAMLAPLGITLTAQTELGVPDVEETGLTFIENAIIKARNAAAHTRMPAIADDSGLEVAALQGEPGIHSARYAGVGAGDADNLQLLLHNLAEMGNSNTTACFQCVIVYMRSDTDAMPLVARGSWYGEITPQPQGDNGFGYDPVFYLPEYGCTAAQLSGQEKNRISHRGLALRQLLEKLRSLTKGNECAEDETSEI